MSRIATTLNVPPKMFRHFAVITLVITALIALLADGERRDAIGQEIANQQQRTKMKQAEADKFGARPLGTNTGHFTRRDSGYSAGNPDTSDMGNPMVTPEGSGYGIADTSDSSRLVSVRKEDLGTMPPPGLAELRNGAKSGTARGPGYSRKKAKPTPQMRQKLDEAGTARGGTATSSDQT